MAVHVLPDKIANQIAAGEVVERPASVVKELVENAIDAGATRIQVEIEEAGKNRIRVTDNGSGMLMEDAERAFRRHATSKIVVIEDLHRIGTLGFRGEALPSIASVAKVRMDTATQGGPTGTRVSVEGGGAPDTLSVAHPPGTTIEVLDLFYNTPARRKFFERKLHRSVPHLPGGDPAGTGQSPHRVFTGSWQTKNDRHPAHGPDSVSHC